MPLKWFDLCRLLRISPQAAEGAIEALGDDFLKNEPVRASMRENGDNGRMPRPIDHYAYFRSPDMRASYREFILSRGYRVVREDVSGNDDGRMVIIFSKVQVPIAIDKETALLEDYTIKLGGDYDGWEADTIRGP